MDDKPDRCAGPDRDRGLDVEISRGELVTGTRDILLGRLPDRLDQIALAGDSQLRSHAEQGGERDALEQRPCVEIDPVLKTGVSGCIGGGLDLYRFCAGHLRV